MCFIIFPLGAERGPGRKQQCCCFRCVLLQMDDSWSLFLFPSLKTNSSQCKAQTFKWWFLYCSWLTHSQLHTQVLSCFSHYHLNEAKYSPVPWSLHLNTSIGWALSSFLCRVEICALGDNTLTQHSCYFWETSRVVFGDLSVWYLSCWTRTLLTLLALKSCTQTYNIINPTQLLCCLWNWKLSEIILSSTVIFISISLLDCVNEMFCVFCS